jgi:hypothetical protein
MSMPATRSATGTPEIEVSRADLARILCAAARDDAEFVYDDTVSRLGQDPDGVDVTFETGPANGVMTRFAGVPALAPDLADAHPARPRRRRERRRTARVAPSGGGAALDHGEQAQPVLIEAALTLVSSAHM